MTGAGTLRWAVLAVLVALASCRHCPDVRSHPDDYAQFNLARERAMYKLIGKYGSCFPPDYGVEAYFSDLKSLGLGSSDLDTLHEPALEVWTEPDCAGFVLLARCQASGPVVLWDKSSTDDALDGPGGSDFSQGATALPPHAPPTSCSCAAKPAP